MEKKGLQACVSLEERNLMKLFSNSLKNDDITYPSLLETCFTDHVKTVWIISHFFVSENYCKTVDHWLQQPLICQVGSLFKDYLNVTVRLEKKNGNFIRRKVIYAAMALTIQ